MEEKRIYTLYVHVNKTNGKRYVGITRQSVEQRWRNGRGYSNNVAFMGAIQKYGWDGFEHIVLAENLTASEAAKEEIRLIAEWKTMNPEYGYNNHPGGTIDTPEGVKCINKTKKERGLLKKVVCVETGEIFDSVADASRKIGCDPSSIVHICNHRSKTYTVGGYHWCYFDEYYDYEYPECRKRQIVCLETGRKFESSREAARVTGATHTGILSCCNGTAVSAKGLHFCYAEDADSYKAREPIKKQRPIVCIETGVVFANAREAGRWMGFHDNVIRGQLAGRQKTAHGYTFSYVDDEDERVV